MGMTATKNNQKNIITVFMEYPLVVSRMAGKLLRREGGGKYYNWQIA